MRTTPIGQAISEQRKKKGLTQEELASLTNVTVRTIQRIESGESKPRSFTLKSIAAALELPFEALVATEDVPEAPATQAQEVPEVQDDPGASHHFIRLLCLSCFSYLVLPFVHFLVPVKLLKNQRALARVMKLARSIIREQITWTICLHLLLLLSLSYNVIQARYGSRTYLVNYLWIVLGMYGLNAVLIGSGLWRARRLTGKTLSITG